MNPDEFIRRYGLCEAFKLLCSDTLYVRNGCIRVNLKDGKSFDVNFKALSSLVKSHRIIQSLGGVVPAIEQVMTYERLHHKKRAAELQVHIDQVKLYYEQVFEKG